MDHWTVRRHDCPDRTRSRFVANLGELGGLAVEIDRHSARGLKIRPGHLPVRNVSVFGRESLKLAHRVEQLARWNFPNDQNVSGTSGNSSSWPNSLAGLRCREE